MGDAVGWVTCVKLTPAQRAVVDRLQRRKHTAYELRRHITLRRQTAVQVKGRGLEAGRVACPSLAAVVNRKPRGPVMSDGPKWWRPADCLWDGDYRQAWEPKRVA